MRNLSLTLMFMGLLLALSAPAQALYLTLPPYAMTIAYLCLLYGGGLVVYFGSLLNHQAQREESLHPITRITFKD